MPHYHFHLTDGIREPDVRGVELANDGEARRHAATFAGELLKGEADEFWFKSQWRVEVTDHSQVLLFTLLMIGIEAPRPADIQAARRDAGVLDD